MVDCQVDDGVVATTEDHPVWNAPDEAWEGPKGFDAGDKVLTADGNLLVTRGLVDDSWTTGSTFNLTVDDLHTYFVVVADQGVLVHNCPSGNFDDMLSGVNAGNVRRVNASQVERLTGQSAHDFKYEILDRGAAISKSDIATGDDGMLYLINKSTSEVVETGVRAIG